MAKYQIIVNDIPQHRVEGSDDYDAIERWLDLMCYDSIEEAANEYFCSVEDIVAEELY